MLKKIKQPIKDDLAALALHVWAAKGQCYLFAAKNFFAHDRDWWPWYRIPERTVDLRLKHLVEKGWIEATIPESNSKASKDIWPKPKKYYRISSKGEKGVIKFLSQRFTREDFTWTQPLLSTCIRCLWEAKEFAHLYELLSIRLGALDSFLAKPLSLSDRIKPPMHHISEISQGNLRNECFQLDSLRSHLEYKLGPIRFREVKKRIETRKDKEQAKTEQKNCKKRNESNGL